MCGIVGLFLKNKALEPQLGSMLSTMLSTMCERGPDSAGFAVYGAPQQGKAKITLQSPNPDTDFAGLADAVSKVIVAPAKLHVVYGEQVFAVPPGQFPSPLIRSPIVRRYRSAHD